MDVLGGLVILGALAVAGVGLIILFSRASNQQQATGQPSSLIRIAALVLGLAAGGSMLFTGSFSLEVAIASVVLLGYGIFGFFATAKRKPAPQPAGQPPTIGNPDAPEATFWRRIKIPLIGCGGLLALAVVAVLAYVLWVWQDRGELAVTAQYPQSVRVGDEFDVVLNLISKTDKKVSVQDIAMDSASGSHKEWILSGAQVVSTSPNMELDPAAASMHGFLYYRDVNPGQMHVVTLHFKAVKAGEYHTDFFVLLPNATAAASDIAITIHE